MGVSSFNDPRSAMHPGGGRGRQCLSDKAHNLWSHVGIDTVEHQVRSATVPALCSNTTERDLDRC